MQANKTCTACGKLGHSKFYCRVRRPRPIKQVGKVAQQWIETRQDWFKMNASPDGFFMCHYCERPMNMGETTLDHKQPRGSHPELRFVMSNLVPCCAVCNFKKGSKSYESFTGKEPSSNI